mmetsp:Transcript_34947/g.99085  ORF Transcript_34947/g.99085 Transcript_34947/m.99085 type:complete len:109 (+) Transcript_34947:446-772(+)
MRSWLPSSWTPCWKAWTSKMGVPASSRSADAAKPLVREFMSRWKDDSRLAGDKSHDEIQESIRILADFYLKHGQRTALPRAVVDSVRGHLLAAKEVLPEPEPKSFLGF